MDIALLVIVGIGALVTAAGVGAGVAALIYHLTRDKSKRPDDDD